MRTADFDFNLPSELIAQQPACRRDQSRLLVLDRASGTLSHKMFPEVVNCFRSGDVLVLNNSRVIPARLRGTNAITGGRFEMLLVEENAANDWWAMMKPGKRARIGTEITVLDLNGRPTAVTATVTEVNAEGHRRLSFHGTDNIAKDLESIGEVPLPPYITREGPPDPLDRERYQTVFAEPRGSVAAPTAGLHFTPEILGKIRARGVEVCFVTLHVGLGTFAPVKAGEVAAHTLHEERYEIGTQSAAIINEAKAAGRRVIATGTTSVRVLESASSPAGQVTAGKGRTSIFIYPPYRFRVVDALLTNFHLPCSTLLMLVSAFAAPGEIRGREMVLGAYAEAVRERYRFFSYGDAMFLM